MVQLAQMLIVVFLTGMVAMIMTRTLNQDVRKYNQLEGDEVHCARCYLVAVSVVPNSVFLADRRLKKRQGGS
eukprot:COSAG01_NODE_2690_length_7247_cov_30.101567_9_plen_72_part_00